jgi:transposase InsO family protein
MAGTESVAGLCESLSLSRSGYYKWKNKGESHRQQEEVRLRVRIQAIHRESQETYGRPRIHAALQQEEICCGHNRVGRIMKACGIQGVQKRRYRPKTTVQDPEGIRLPNLVPDVVIEPWTVVVTDITYLATKDGWRYLSAVMDLGSRRILGWALGSDLKTPLVEASLMKSLRISGSLKDWIHHSDKGCQYTSGSYQDLLKEYGMKGSMSGTGNCYENAAMESFWSTLKAELIRGRVYETEDELRRALFHYIEVFYNRKRLHSSLGFMTPMAYEEQFRLKLAA